MKEIGQKTKGIKLDISIKVVSDGEVGCVLDVIKQILNNPDEADIPLYFSRPGKYLKMDFGKSFIIADILRDAGCINISKEGIISMTEEQMQMGYSPSK